MGRHTESLLVELTAGVWYADAKIRMPGGALLPMRMTVLQLDDGSLLIHSPIQLSEDLAESIAQKGPVRILLAPNGFHHLFIAKWQIRFPDALTYGPRILSKKRPDLQFDHYVDGPLEAPWGPDIQMTCIAGMPKIQEMVIYHRPSRTLVVTDLIFNIKQASGSLRWILRIMGTYQKLASSRLFQLMVRDRPAYLKSIEQILELPMEYLIMAHGDIVKGKDCQNLRHALQR